MEDPQVLLPLVHRSDGLNSPHSLSVQVARRTLDLVRRGSHPYNWRGR